MNPPPSPAALRKHLGSLIPLMEAGVTALMAAEPIGRVTLSNRPLPPLSKVQLTVRSSLWEELP
jgi:hypothetical protein